jgi:hypothetical protein
MAAIWCERFRHRILGVWRQHAPESAHIETRGLAMKTRSIGCLVLCFLAACTSRGTPSVPAPNPEAQVGARDIELLEVRRLESSSAEGTVVVRVVNIAPGPILLGIDVRAEPGMWFAPVRQQTALYYLPPEGERTFSVGYSFAHLTPEAVLHVRIGTAEEHGDGWVYVPEPVAVRRFDLGRSDAARALLDRFHARTTPQLTVYGVRGMFSAEQLDSVAASRSHAVQELNRMLDVKPPPGLTLVLYPDGASKTADTHHVGAGMTKGSYLAEVFNDSIRLDPFHEIAHAMSGQLGWAPAWLNEGFAVYASEHLGADALAQIVSPGTTVDQATCELRRAGNLLPMADLMLLPDIGPEESQPHVSYPQAASFTSYLVRRFGWPALRTAYATISASDSADAQESAFTRTFGVSSMEAAGMWMAHLEQLCS